MRKILLIDDNELLGGMLQTALEEHRFEVRVAYDANTGFRQALEFLPDLILLDVELPDIAGPDVVRLLKNRAELRHIPVIMITGTHRDTAQKVKAFQAGADDYVLKPIAVEELVERIAAVLRRGRAQEPPYPAGGGAGYVPSPAYGGARHGPPPLVIDSGPPHQPMDSGTEVSEQNVRTIDSAPETVKSPEISLTRAEAVRRTLLCPQKLSGIPLPAVTLPYLAALLALSLGGWALSAGSTVKPALIGMGAAGFWGLCVAGVVMACSIMGIPLTWRNGARLIALAGLPLLLKLLGGVVLTIATSLNPFYFTASPALFFKSSPALLERLDIFELWMIWLVWKLVRQCRGSTQQKAWAAAAVVWPVVAFWQSLWKH